MKYARILILYSSILTIFYAVTAKYSKYVPTNVKELTQVELAEIPQVMLTYREPFNRADYTNNDRFDYTYNITFETTITIFTTKRS